MADRDQRFRPGDLVQRTNQPEAIGVVREARWDSQTERWNYLVQFGAANRAVPEDAIQKLVTVQTPWDALRQGQLSGIDHFIFTLTFHRLQNPPARIARSFATARTLFYPHQFKPLLKFLDNPGKRLLIADDVGLGKTIEAGYILRELEAHEPIERVLIVVPARLLHKWKRELQTRFQEYFDIVKGGDIIRQTERIRQGRDLEPFRWIVSYESVRPEEVRIAIEETQFPIDVLVADEAHRMRNPETLQHKVGATLCRISADTAIFLSATPVQNKLEDLWHLLRLLSEEEFAEWYVFREQMEANRYLLAAQRSLATRDFERAEHSLNAFVESQSGRAASGGTFLRSVVERARTPTIDRREMVELQADIGRLSPTGHILCRTRKSEALTRRPERAASWKRVPLTEEEREIYDSIEGYCRATWPGVSESWGFQMSLMMAYRMTASCMPAAMSYFAEKLSATEVSIWSEEIEEQEEHEEKAHEKGVLWTGAPRQSFLDLVSLYNRLVKQDSKLTELINALTTIWSEDALAQRPRRKVVIFSFFRRTLEYLRRQLSEQDIHNRMIHGGIAVDDREAAIDDFLESPTIQVLLTSEVGGEGLDLQQASVVINYDLPWNPMIVEQRVGRVDRIGQDAERIVILNLIIEESIEERVLRRLLDKIEIFRGSIGEMDDIIGEQIERITAAALRGELSGDELDRIVEEQGNAIARRIQEARTLLTKVDGLLAADQALIDEINSVVGERQIPAEPELLKFLNRVFEKRVSGCQLPQSTVHGVVEVDLRRLARALEEHASGLGADALAFARKLGTGAVHLTLSREAGYTHPRVELIHGQHPLTRYAVAEVARDVQQRQAAFAIKLLTQKLPAGDYGFLVASILIRSHRPSTKLVAIFVSRDGEQVWWDPDETTPVVIQMLESGRDLEVQPLSDDESTALQSRLMFGLQSLKSEWEARESRLDQARREQQLASRRATLEFLANRATDRLNGLVQKGAAPFAVRMAEARVVKTRRELKAFVSAPPFGPWGGIEYEEVAVGLLRVEPEGGNA
jgi:superfamily II DNA or RNA helicase